MSIGSSFAGGVRFRIGGVDRSDTDEPAVDGLASNTGDSALCESLLTEGFFRAGTPSGHLHCSRE